MADVTYQCAVNKAHTKKGSSMVAPYCCGKAMTVMQAATAAAAPSPQSAAPTTAPKPAATPANAPKPQAPTQGVAGTTAQQPPKK